MTNKTYFKYWGKAEKGQEGKPPKYHLLPYHCLDVAAVGHVLLENNVSLRDKFIAITGLDAWTCNYWLVLFSAFHDIGKFSENFQNLRPDLLTTLQALESSRSYQVRHDSLGNLFLKKSFEAQNPEFLGGADFEEWQDVVMALVRACTGHHGKPPQMQGPNGLPLNFQNFFMEENSVAAKQFIQDAGAMLSDHNQKILPLTFSYELEARMKKATWLIAGFAVLCDWIGSNNTWFPFCERPMELEEYWRHHAIPQAERALHDAEISRGMPLRKPLTFSGLFPCIKRPTPLQVFVEQCQITKTSQLFILEDVTGSGKTEAALLLAEKLMAAGCGTGFFMALPTMATSNAMFKRLAENPDQDEPPVYFRLFEQNSSPSIVLAHGARHLSETFMASVAGRATEETDPDSASAHCSSWLADNRKKSLLADVGVGTLDQALLAVLPARFQSLRLFGLASHVLIVDEVHAYDPYMNKLLQNLLSFHAALGGSAILLSATLPTGVRRGFIEAFATGLEDHRNLNPAINAYPLATSYSKEAGVLETPVEATDQRRSSIKVKLVANEGEVVREILDAAGKGKCVCWIRNTVHDALAGYACLKGELAESDLMLFHARYAMGDRLDIENAVTTIFGKESSAPERSGKVLVATQVVEQSLDLDFDLLVSDLAPMDLLIQRAGRLHRHRRDEYGTPLPEGEGPDRREPPWMIIHGPVPETEVTKDWYKSKFEKASYVYPSHGCLWLTARLLADKGELKMPDDARELIEAAFSEDEETGIPEQLRLIDMNAKSDFVTFVGLAHINMLKLDEGYEATITQWREDMKTPTRLGGMDTTVRLARWDGTTLLPWYAHEKFPWDMSQVNIRNGLVDSAREYTGDLGKEITQLNERLPDRGKWTVLVPLIQGEDGCWRGEALNKNQEAVVLEYDRLTGVTVAKKEG